jgi:hypothetical protein
MRTSRTSPAYLARRWRAWHRHGRTTNRPTSGDDVLRSLHGCVDHRCNARLADGHAISGAGRSPGRLAPLSS